MTCEVPYITADQMREVDRLMVDHYGIKLPQMMENAGRNLARATRTLFLEGDPRGREVAVLCGSGGNGGGGLVAARRLMNWGAKVTVWLARPGENYCGVPGHQLRILKAMNADLRDNEAPAILSGDLILDAFIGYSLSGPPTGRTAELIRAANACETPRASLGCAKRD